MVEKAVSTISLIGGEVGQPGDAAFAGAGAEGNHDLGFLAQQFGNVFILIVAHAAVEQAAG